MSAAPDPIRAVIDSFLRDAGFTKKADSWYRRDDQVVEVVNLQKSQFGGQHHLNFAIWLNELGDTTHPKEHQCHVRMRAHRIAADPAQVERLLDLDSADAGREADLAEHLKSEFLPFAEACRSVAGLREKVAAGFFAGALLTAKARAILGGSS